MSAKVAIEGGDVNAGYANSDDGEIPNSLFRNANLANHGPSPYSPQFQPSRGPRHYPSAAEQKGVELPNQVYWFLKA